MVWCTRLRAICPWCIVKPQIQCRQQSSHLYEHHNWYKPNTLCVMVGSSLACLCYAKTIATVATSFHHQKMAYSCKQSKGNEWHEWQQGGVSAWLCFLFMSRCDYGTDTVAGIITATSLLWQQWHDHDQCHTGHQCYSRQLWGPLQEDGQRRLLLPPQSLHFINSYSLYV